MENRKPITEHGLFWLRDNEERKLWGTLYVDERNGARLETFGSLIDVGEETLHTIMGQIRSGGQWVTLIDCFPTNTLNQFLSRVGETDWSRQTYRVNRVVKGIGFEDGEEIAFEEAIIKISTLPEWANPKIVKLQFAEGNTRPMRVNIAIEERVDETTTVIFRGEKIKISLVFSPKEEWAHHGAITRYSVEDDCFLRIDRGDNAKVALERILLVVGAILDLLSICCNETAKVIDFNVHYEREKRSPAEVYVRMRGYDAENNSKQAFPALSLEDLGGMEGLARWILVRERYGAAAALLTSIWYNEKAYSEDNLARMYASVEGLLSRKKNRKKARMNIEELATFVEEAIPNFSGVTKSSSGDWAERVKRIRDEKLSHTDPISKIETDGLTMHIMTNVLYVAGAAFLLREMGMGEDKIRQYIQRCYQSMLLNRRR